MLTGRQEVVPRLSRRSTFGSDLLLHDEHILLGFSIVGKIERSFHQLFRREAKGEKKYVREIQFSLLFLSF